MPELRLATDAGETTIGSGSVDVLTRARVDEIFMGFVRTRLLQTLDVGPDWDPGLMQQKFFSADDVLTVAGQVCVDIMVAIASLDGGRVTFAPEPSS